jgi:predicted enzyme related to lactoylglutathione lyase
MTLGALGQVHISVTDVERSVTFYRDVLGIPHLFTVPGPAAADARTALPARMAFFQAGDVRLYLGVPEATEFTSRCVLYFRVDDIDAEVARLRSAEIEVGDPHVAHRAEASELWLAGLKDPDSHHIILMEDRPV